MAADEPGASRVTCYSRHLAHLCELPGLSANSLRRDGRTRSIGPGVPRMVNRKRNVIGYVPWVVAAMNICIPHGILYRNKIRTSGQSRGMSGTRRPSDRGRVGSGRVARLLGLSRYCGTDLLGEQCGHPKLFRDGLATLVAEVSS